MLWFIGFGVFGVLFYCLSWSVIEVLCNVDYLLKDGVGWFMFVLDFILVRIIVFGMLMMGYFLWVLFEWIKFVIKFDVFVYDVLI